MGNFETLTIYDVIRKIGFDPRYNNIVLEVLASYGKGYTENGERVYYIEEMEEYAKGWIGRKYGLSTPDYIKYFMRSDIYLEESSYEILALQLEYNLNNEDNIDGCISTMTYLLCAYEDLSTETYQMFDFEKEAKNFSKYYENEDISLENFRANNYEKTKKLLLMLHRTIIQYLVIELVKNEKFSLLLPLLCNSSDEHVIYGLVHYAPDPSVLLNINSEKFKNDYHKTIKARLELNAKILKMPKEEQEEFNLFMSSYRLNGCCRTNGWFKDQDGEYFDIFAVRFILLKELRIEIPVPSGLAQTCDVNKAFMYYIYRGLKEGTIELKPGIVLPGININKRLSSLSK